MSIKTDSEHTLVSGIDWNWAAHSGAMLVSRGPAVGQEVGPQIVAELAELVVRAQNFVTDVTGLALAAPLASAKVVNRAGWVRATARSMAQLSNSGQRS